MTQYLLPCDCGAEIPVSRSQAGMSVPCPACGKSLDVPTIRNLANLKPAPVAANTTARDHYRPPNILQRIAAGIFFLVAVGGLGYGGLVAYQRVTLPIDMSRTEEDFYAESKESLEAMSPADTWDTWNAIAYAGVTSARTPDYFLIKRAYENSAKQMYLSLGIGSVGLAIFVACLFIAPKRSQS